MDNLIQVIRNLGPVRLITFGGVIITTIFIFVILGGRLGQGQNAVLFSGLAQQDAASIVQALETEGVPYELDAGGTTIKVPEDQRDRLRLTLAGDGLSGGIIGKEIFDQDSSFGRTSFELNVNLIRATEGELSRTIRSIQSVNEARVHIVMAERRPFQRDASEPSASILVRTLGGGLAARQVQAIQSLVASAVPGLTPDNVTITDTAGRLLSDGNSVTDVGGFSSLEQARLSKEQLYRDKIESLLSRTVGNGNVRAEVSVDMNLNRTTQNQIIYDPDNQVVVSQTANEETSRDEEANPNDGTATVANNLPDAQAQGGTSVNTTSRTDETTNFENSRTETVTVIEPGEITRLRISVLVNSAATITAADGTISNIPVDTAALEELVKTAVPFDEARQDQVTVQALAFAPVPDLTPTDQPFQVLGYSLGQLASVAADVGLVLFALVFLLLVVRPMIMKLVDTIPEALTPPTPPQLEGAAAGGAPAITGPDAPVTADLIAAAAAGDEEAAAAVRAAKSSGALTTENFGVESKIDVAQVEGRIQESAVKRVADIIKSNPDESVAIVRSWLYAD